MIEVPILDTSIRDFMNSQYDLHKEFSYKKLQGYLERNKLIQTKLMLVE